MITDRSKVRDYYDGFDEWRRLESPAGVLEYERTLEILGQHLVPRSRILDLGGGPGRYTIALAQLGHRVCLADLSEKLLEVARLKIAEYGVQERVESVDQVDAADLSRYESGSFDAVLAMGPFYHLTDPGVRCIAAREVTRVLRPGGMLVVAFIPRLSGLAGLIDRAAVAPEQVSVAALAEAAARGVFHNASPRGFQEGYYPEPHELVELLDGHGVSVATVVSTRGFAYGREVQLLKVRSEHPELYAQFAKAISDTASDPAAVALGGHALYLGYKSSVLPA